MKMQDRANPVFMFVGGGIGKRDVPETPERHHPTNVADPHYQSFHQIRHCLSVARYCQLILLGLSVAQENTR